MDFQACSVILLHLAHHTKCTTQVNRHNKYTENLGLSVILGVVVCGGHNDNLRSKTPSENSTQIFPSLFGSYSVRVMRENRLHTHAGAHTHTQE